jgi:DNA-binding NarL/FixJ family response regulator
MPGIDGIEIAVKLAASSALTAVIHYTAEPARSILLASVDAGVRGLVLKGSPLQDLARAIRVVAEGGSYIDAALAFVLAGPDAGERILSLTKRERGVLRLLGEGMRDEQVGRTLSISPLTVRADVLHSMTKLGCATRTEAVAAVLR